MKLNSDRCVFIAFFLMFLLSGCVTMFDPPSNCVDRGDGMCWWKNPFQIPVTKYVWEVDTVTNASTRCGYNQNFENASCIMGRIRESGTCHIVSALTENQAKARLSNSPTSLFSGKGDTVFCHEARDHCGLNICGETDGTQWLHTPGPVRSVLDRR